MSFRVRKTLFGRTNVSEHDGTSTGRRLERRHPCLLRRGFRGVNLPPGSNVGCDFGRTPFVMLFDGGLGGFREDPVNRLIGITLTLFRLSSFDTAEAAALQARMPALQSAPVALQSPSPNLFAHDDVLQPAEFRRETLIT